MFELLMLAPLVPGPEIDPGSAVTGLIGSLQGGQWALLAGFACMLVTYVLQLFVFPNVSSKVLPWVAVAIATLGWFGVSVVADPTAWLSAVILGVQSGLAAAGTYGLLPTKVKDAMKRKVAERQ